MIVVVTMFSESHQSLANICLPNLQAYCDRHGYQLVCVHPENDKCWFKKHEAFDRIFEGLGEDGIIFYCDIDTLIMNHEIKVESFVNEVHSFYLTRDFTELNGGSIILKTNKVGKWINDFILSKQNYPNEQNVYNWYIDYLRFYDNTKVLPQNTINSYDYSLYPECSKYVGKHECGDFKEGDFLIHFPGLGIDDKIKLMNQYKQRIIK